MIYVNDDELLRHTSMQLWLHIGVVQPKDDRAPVSLLGGKTNYGKKRSFRKDVQPIYAPKFCPFHLFMVYMSQGQQVIGVLVH